MVAVGQARHGDRLGVRTLAVAQDELADGAVSAFQTRYQLFPGVQLSVIGLIVRQSIVLELGPLLTASHESLRDDYEVSVPAVEEVMVNGPSHMYIERSGKIIRVDSLVTQKGHWLFNVNSYLKYTKQESWGPIFKYQKTSPGAMIAGANAYLDGFSPNVNARSVTDAPRAIEYSASANIAARRLVRSAASS
mgnify:CR=1 FL=1